MGLFQWIHYLIWLPRVGLGQSPLFLYFPISPPSTLSFSIFSFFLFPFLTRFICFLAFPANILVETVEKSRPTT